MNDPAVIFESLLKGGGAAGGTGYPYQIKARDLDRAFASVCLAVDPAYVKTRSTAAGHASGSLDVGKIIAEAAKKAGEEAGAGSTSGEWVKMYYCESGEIFQTYFLTNADPFAGG